MTERNFKHIVASSLKQEKKDENTHTHKNVYANTTGKLN